MKTRKPLLTLVCLIALSAPVLAQPFTATWYATVDSDWNNAGNWDTLDVPGIGTNALINAGYTANYTTPMAAANFAGVNNSGTLNISAAGFNIDAATLVPYTGAATSQLTVNSGGIVVITNSGAFTLQTSSALSVEGGSLIMSNNFNPIVMGSSESSGANAGVGITNNGGNIIFDQELQWRSRDSRFIMNGGTLNALGGVAILETGNDVRRPFLINGGTANLGNVAISKTSNGAGVAGLVVSNNAVVNLTSFRLGTANSAAGSTVYGGVLTNTGAFLVSDRNNAATSGTRSIRFYVRGGTVVSTVADGIVLANQANNSNTGGSSVWGAFLDINAGTIIAEKLTLVGPNALTNAHATLTLSGSGAIYLGSGGLVGNVGYSNTSYTMSLNGGTLGAKADYSIVGNGTLGGTFTVKAADLADNPHTIAHTGAWGGAGALVKTGGGTLALNAANTYSGATTVSEGTLAIGGSIANTPSITVAAGATLDISAVAPYTLASDRTLQGEGTVIGRVAANSGAVISPAGAGAVGILTFAGGLTQNGGVINNIEFSAVTNDVIEVVGDLDLNPAGTNLIAVTSTGGAISAGTYTLIHYSGTLLNGDATKFQLSGILGTITHNAGTKTISLTTSGLRAPTSVFWTGGTPNNWDVIKSLNWKDGISASYFVNGDSARFDAAGAANPSVNLVEVVLPGSVTVDAATDYTFSGIGNIGGTGGLTKINSGKLTINTTNSYTGVTTIGGGVLEVSAITNGGLNSAIGSSASGSANLVLDGGTLRYTGSTVASDRGATLNASGGAADVQSAAATLTLSGKVVGDGSLTKAGSGGLVLSGANTYTNGTEISAGVLQLNNATAAGTGPVTNNSATMRVNGAIAVDNVLNFNGTCNLELSGVGSGNVALRGAWNGSGTVRANFLTQNTSQTLSIGGEGAGGGAMWDFAGTLDLGTNRGFCRLNNNSSINFGSSNATFNLGTGDVVFSQRNGGTTTYLGALMGGPNTRLQGRRGDVSGTCIYAIGGNNLSTAFEGIITNGINEAAVTKVGTGTLTLTGVSPFTGATTVEAGTLQVDGSITASAITVTGGTLSGSGTLGGTLDVQYGGTLSPGASIGKLTINNWLNLASGSTNIMEISKSAGTNDSVVGLTSVFYSGTLVVRNLAGTLSGGETFKLFDATPGSYLGAFEAYDLPSLPPGLSWDTSGLLVDGTIKVAAPVLELTVIGSDLVIHGTNGVPNGNYNVLTSTNVAALRSQWITNATYQFDGFGGFSFTNAIDPGTPQKFFRMEIP